MLPKVHDGRKAGGGLTRSKQQGCPSRRAVGGAHGLIKTEKKSDRGA